MAPFIQSLDLNAQFYDEVIRPLMRKHFPDLNYSAARLGAGSDVLGYDDEMSSDHDWGIRQQLFLRDEDFGEMETAVFEMLRHQLPYEYKGYSVHFGAEDEEGTRLLENISEGPVDHRIELTTVSKFTTDHLGFDATQAWDAITWLTVPQQQLLGVTKGRVFADDLGVLTTARASLAYFPDDVWFYLLACQWNRIGQEDHFMGRTGIRGDEIGSRLLASRLVHDVMMLGFLLEKQYAPYPKWFGTAFKALNCAEKLEPILLNVLTAVSWQERERYLCQAFTVLGYLHNELGLTQPLPTGCEQFHGRPFQVHCGGYASSLWKLIKDDVIRSFPPIGSIDQFSDNTDLRSYPKRFVKIRPLYE